MLGDGDYMEGWCDWWGLPGVWGGVSLGAFEMAAKLRFIKLFAVIVTVFDFVTLIDGVKRDYFPFMESSACKPFTNDHTIRENSCVCQGVGHPLNWRGEHPLSLLGGGS